MNVEGGWYALVIARTRVFRMLSWLNLVMTRVQSGMQTAASIGFSLRLPLPSNDSFHHSLRACWAGGQIEG